MTNVNQNAENVHVTASTTKQIETKNGIEKINITQIPFIPDTSIMMLSTNDLAKAVNSTLRPIIDGFRLGRVYTKGNKIGFQICINVNSRLIVKSPLTVLGAKDAYTMSDELRDKLSPFLEQGEVTTSIVKTNRNGETGMVIELNALKSIMQTLQSPPEGYIYKIDRIAHVKKNQEALIQVSMTKKNIPVQDKFKNNKYNKENKHDNNRKFNNDRNRGYYR